MVWRLELSQTAEKEVEKLDKAMARKVMGYLSDLCQMADPTERGHPLTGPLAGKHRYRIGQLRIVCDIKRSVIVIHVLKVGRRDSIY